MKRIQNIIVIGLLLNTLNLSAQQLYTQANAASLTNEANAITGWNSAASASIVSDASESYSGSYSLKIAAPNDGWARATYTFNTEVNAAYIIKIHAKKGANSSNPGFYLWDGFSNFNPQGITTANWTEYTFNLTANATTATLKVYSGSPSIAGHTVYIDNVSIIKVDSNAPTPPTTLSNDGQSSTSVNLSWSGATDNVGVTGYKVYKGVALEATLTNVSVYQVTGLSSGTLYQFTVKALDAYGNESLSSNPLNITTDAASSGGGYWTQNGTTVHYNTGNVGLGTNTPTSKLHIKDPAGGAALAIERGSKSWNFSIQHTGDKLYLNNSTTPDNIFTFSKEGQLGIGTTNLRGDKLAVNGNIRAKEIKVEIANWPDYVFTKTYALPTLAEVAKHITEKGRLINMPSARDVEMNGIELGEMKRLLLEKVEELTLYIIDIKKENQVQQNQVQKVVSNGIQLGEMNKLLMEKIEELTLYDLQQEGRIITLENLKK